MSSESTQEPGLRDSKHLRWVYLALSLLSRARIGSRHRVFLLAVVIGVAGALSSYIFKELVHGINHLMTGSASKGYVDAFQHLSLLQRILIPTIGSAFAGLLLMAGKRIDTRQATDYMEAVSLGNGDVPARPSILKSVAAACSIGSGVSIGREGPLVQLAAVGASILGRLLREPPARLRLLVACGAAAGVAAAYNAPIGGAIFVAEIIIGSIAVESLGPLLVASVASTITIRAIDPNLVSYSIQTPFESGFQSVLLFAVLGILCGFAAPLFIATLKAGKRIFAPIRLPLPIKLGIGGLLFGLIAAFHPEVAGNGQSVIRGMLDGMFTWQTIGMLALLKILAVTVVFGSGTVGGVFTPSLLVGASLGYLWSVMLHQLGFAIIPPEVSALVGMGSFLAAATHAPFMAVFLLFEMCLHPGILIPLTVSTLFSYSIARSLGGASLYLESLQSGPKSVFDKDIATLTVSEIVRPQGSRTLPSSTFGEIATRFLRASEDMLPVTDPDGHFLGSILLQDVRPYLKERVLADSIIARDIMREDLPTLDASFDLPHALRTFSETGHPSLPVTDTKTGILLGMLEKNDLYLVVSEITRRAGVHST